MIYFIRMVRVFLLLSTFALAQDKPDSKETLLEQAIALAEEQSPDVNPVPPIPLSMLQVTHPLFVGVDDINVPAYVGDPGTRCRGTDH